MNLKIFLSILVPMFIVAMATGIYLAYSNEEGLVENNYYEKGKAYFRMKSEERQLDLAVNPPEELKKGVNEIFIHVTSHGKPFSDAHLTLFVGNVSTTSFDRSMDMREHTPGYYHTETTIPSGGKWLMRVDLEKDNLSTNRKWFFDVN